MDSFNNKVEEESKLPEEAKLPEGFEETLPILTKYSCIKCRQKVFDSSDLVIHTSKKPKEIKQTKKKQTVSYFGVLCHNFIEGPPKRMLFLLY